MRSDEVKIYGQHACRAVFERRFDDVIRVLVSKRCAGPFSAELKSLAAQRRSYRIVEEEDLEKFSGGRHHEGICILAKTRETQPLERHLQAEGRALVLALEQVGNPHNVGTLLRTAAHFGVDAVLLSGPQRRLASAAYRTAEGAAEFVDVYFAEALDGLLDTCREAGLSVCATSSHKGDSLYDAQLPQRAVIVLGAEGDGLSNQLIESADRLLTIPGSAQVESLNVASSAAVLLGEHWRQYG